MKWSLRLGSLFGIGVYVHWTFALLLLWVAVMHWPQGLAKTLEGVGFLLAIFGCVVLHEFGHALMARRFGIQTRDVTLLPIGGVARLERMPEDPMQELWVALAGPAVNVAIAAITLGVLVVQAGAAALLLQTQELADPAKVVASPFLVKLMAANVVLVLFNLLPAFPMDGGRVLRALLATFMSRVRATHIAATVGQGMAILFGIVGLLTGMYLLLFVALFVYLGAQGEAQAVEMKSIFQGVKVREAMASRFQTLPADAPLQTAIDELLAGHQPDFPVTDQGGVVGLLLRSDLMQAVKEGRPGLCVRDVMRVDCAYVAEEDRLDRAVELLQQGDSQTLPVVRDGRLVGLLTTDNVGEWAAIHAALRERKGGRGAPG